MKGGLALNQPFRCSEVQCITDEQCWGYGSAFGQTGWHMLVLVREISSLRGRAVHVGIF